MKINYLSVILPVHNEKKTIGRVLEEWAAELKSCRLAFQIIVCEDGSTDGTKKILSKLKSKYKLTLNQVNERRGYGGAVIDGIKSAKYNYILCIDSDGQCSPKDLKKFLGEYKDNVLIGWRTKRADSKLRIYYSKLFGVVFHLLFPTKIHDPSAPYVIFRKIQILPLIPYLRFMKEAFWWGFVATCIKKNIPIEEIPITHNKRYQGETQVYKFTKIFDVAFRNIVGLFRLKIAK